MPIYEDVLHPLDTTLVDPVAAHEDEVFVPAEATAYFRSGDLVKIDDELLRVADLAPGGLLTVERGWGASVASDHAAGAQVRIIGVSSLEGGAPFFGTARVVEKQQVSE